MAKPNHQFEKRQRELAKQKKKEEKRLRKLSAANPEDETGQVSDENADPDAAVAPDQATADDAVESVVKETVE